VCQEFSARLGRAVGNELREFVLNVALHIPGVVGVCAVTRTRGFRWGCTRSIYSSLSIPYERLVPTLERIL
jgi:hypothetical protein